MNTSVTQKIPTGLYTEKAAILMAWLKAKMELQVKQTQVYRSHIRYRMYDTVKRDTRMSKTGTLFQLEQCFDNEVIFVAPQRIKKPNASYSYIYSSETYVKNRRDVVDMKSWLAHLLKTYVVDELGKDAWKRNCPEDKTISFTIPEYFEKLNFSVKYNSVVLITVKELYCFYEILKGRKNLKNRYGAKFYNEFTGSPANPIITEMNRARAEAIEQAKANFELAKEEANKWKEKELHRIYTEIKEKLQLEVDQRIDMAEKLYNKEIEEANSVMEILKNTDSKNNSTPENSEDCDNEIEPIPGVADLLSAF